MRPALVSVLLLGGCTAASTPAPPQAAQPASATPIAAGPTQMWQGALRCGPVSGLANLPLNQPIELAVTGGVARYYRDVRRGAAAGETDVGEQGGGTLAPDGSLTLSGQASAPSYRYGAQYSGMLRPDGGLSRLAGKQMWYPQHRGKPVDRNCSITLRRVG